MFVTFVAWVRGLDIRKVAAALIVLDSLEHGIVVGDVPLAGALPALLIAPIVAWCKILVYVNPFLLAGHSFTATKWPTVPAPVAKALMLFAMLLTAAMMFVQPASAQTVAKAPPAAATSAVDCVLTLCEGPYLGANIVNAGANFDVIGQGLTGLASNGIMGGLHAGYEFWNDQLFAAIEADVEYDVTANNGGVGTGLSGQYALGGQVKLGYTLAQLFGAAASGQAVPTLPQQLLSSLISPYIAIGVWDRPWGAGLLTGAGVQALIAQNWTLDAEYFHVNYNNAQVNPNTSEQSENDFMLALSRHF
jgi:opacity protein-like surface antigen